MGRTLRNATIKLRHHYLLTKKWRTCPPKRSHKHLWHHIQSQSHFHFQSGEFIPVFVGIRRTLLARLNFSTSLIGINTRCKGFISRAAIAFFYYSGFLIFIFLKAYANSQSKLSTRWTVCNLGLSRSRLSQLAIATLSGHVKNWEAEGSHRFHILPREWND